MAEYVEEYLVALGYDLHSEEGQKYLQMCEDMERRHEELTKSGKSLEDQFKENSKAQQISISGDKAETEQLAKLDDMYRQLHKTQSETTQVKPAAPTPEAPVKAPTSKPEAPPPQTEEPHPKKKRAKAQEPETAPSPKATAPVPPPKQPSVAPQKAPRPSASGEMSGDQKKRVEGDREEINLLGDMEKTVRQIGVAWNQLEHGNVFGAFTQGIKGVKQFSDMIEKAGSSAQTAGKKSDSSKQSLLDLLKVKGSSPAKAASSGSEVAETAAAGGEAAGAGAEAGAAAAGAAGGPVGIVAALAIMAAAEAIKKVSEEVADLTEGLAQTNVQIETMSRQLWISQSAAYQLNGTLNAMGKTTADLNEIAINPTMRKQFQDLQNYEKTMLQLPADFDQINKQWGQDVDENGMKINAQLQHIKQMTGYTFEKLLDKPIESFLDKVLGGLEWIDNKLFGAGNSAVGTAANYAPQSSSYNYATNAKIEYSPRINVTAPSSSASDIAEATAQATQQSFNEAALIKSVQGLNR